MLYLLLILVIYGLEYGPLLMFEWASRRNSAPRPDFKYTGSELARLLLDQNGLADVQIEPLPPEISDFGDCYDPGRRVVRLSAKVMSGRTLAAYAVAAHEVGHAVQHAANDEAMQVQRGLIFVARAAILALIGGVLFLIMFSDRAGGREQWHWLSTALLAFYLGSVTLIRFVALPVEWSASFDHALPMLRRLQIIDKFDLEEVRKLLFLAATTYIGFAILAVLASIVLLST